METTQTCPVCHGSGRKWVDPARDRSGDPMKVCTGCNGAGKVLIDNVNESKCAYCAGSGQVYRQGRERYKQREDLVPCPACHGKGRVKIPRL